MPEPEVTKPSSNTSTVIYMLTLSIICALILSIIASALSGPQAQAKALDRSEQMLIAAKILSHEGYFLIRGDHQALIPAKYSEGKLIAGTKEDYATSAQILDIFHKLIVPLLVDDKGNLQTFIGANVDENQYLSKFKKIGYADLPLKLIYKILEAPLEGQKQDPLEAKEAGWVIPINGFGLWDAIYGYLAIEPDGDTVIGITWYDQKETPGLGANIATPEWQNLFPGKLIFLEGPNGKTDFKTDPLGITVIKGKVSEVLQNSPKAKSSVDGMAGATLTGNGVTDAYRDSLEPYRQFLIKVHNKNVQQSEPKGT